jgi:hypothetical protein
MSHKITHFALTVEPPKHFARCSCGFRTKDYLQPHHVGDEVLRHQNAVERLRLQLGTRTPSLKNQRDYFEEMAANEGLPEADRVLWARLAEEITQRLNDRDDASSQQPGLF